MNDLDLAASRIFERSAIVRALERGASRLRASAARSRAIHASGPWLSAARGHAGHVLVAAAATHLLLMIAIAQPPSWHFAILPSIFLVAGIVLIATRKP